MLKNINIFHKPTDIIPFNEYIENLIQIKSLCKTFVKRNEGIVALKDVNLTIQRGEFIIILGQSGSGKSTFLNILGTLDTPSSGSYSIGNFTITKETKEIVLSQLRRDTIGFVFQNFNLLPKISAIQNVELPMLLKGRLNKEERKQRAQELLDLVGLSHRYDHSLVELSGGEQQRVTIARSLANDPEILLLDEPTGDLDEHSSHEIMKIMKLQQDTGRTIIMVTHNLNLKQYANRIIYMSKGTISKIETISKYYPKSHRNSQINSLSNIDNINQIEDMKNYEDLNIYTSITNDININDTNIDSTISNNIYKNSINNNNNILISDNISINN